MRLTNKTKKITTIAILIALCAVLSFLDQRISTIFAFGQGIKIGLANIVILSCLYYFNFKDILTITITKSLLVGLFLGSINTFLISLAGSVLSATLMYITFKLLKDKVTLYSVSFVGSISHATGQLLVVAFYNKVPLEALLPTSLMVYLISVVTSIFVAVIAQNFVKYLKRNNIKLI